MKTKTEITKNVTLEITKNDIIEWLLSKGEIPNDYAEVYFSVPGGGDWSNMDISIDEDNPIFIKYQIKE